MAFYSAKAALRPAKGGLPNVLYLHSGFENLPEALSGLASAVTILLPWGSLLKAVAKPEMSALNEIARLCRENATLRIIFGYELTSEQKVIEELGLPLLIPQYLETSFRNAYLEAGFHIQWKMLTQDALKSLPTTWAKKLGYGKPRQFLEVTAKYKKR